MESIAVDILKCIFDFQNPRGLKTMTLVCKRWKHVAEQIINVLRLARLEILAKVRLNMRVKFIKVGDTLSVTITRSTKQCNMHVFTWHNKLVSTSRLPVKYQPKETIGIFISTTNQSNTNFRFIMTNHR